MLIGCQEVQDESGATYLTFSVEGTDEEIKRFYNRDEIEIEIEEHDEQHDEEHDEEQDFYDPENEEQYKEFLLSEVDNIDINWDDV